MKKILYIMIIFVMFFPIYAFSAEVQTTFYVSVDGNDYWNGTKQKPYKTLYRAREAVRYLKKSGKITTQTSNIVVENGKYTFNKSFYLDSRDNNVNYRGVGNVVFTGGAEFENNTSSQVEDLKIYSRLPQISRDKVRCVNLNNYLNSIEECSEIATMSIDKSDFIVSYNDVQMTNARYPNDKFMNINKVYKSGKEGQDSFVIGYDDENISLWQNPKEIYLEGYGSVLWRYQKIHINSLDKTNKKIFSENTLLFSGIYAGAKVWFSNVLEELDSPGEWYMDRANKKMYYYPLSETGTLKISLLEEPIIVSAMADNISFSNITFENTKSNGVNLYGVTNFVFQECTIKNIGNIGINIEKSSNSGIKNSIITKTGCGGIKLMEGGDKYDLKPSGNFVLNNEICDFSKVIPTYSPAVWVSGIGDVVSYNTIHESFHTGIILSGNDNEISHNEIYNVLMGTQDAGAIYAHGDGSARGNIIENNFIHHLGDGTKGFDGEGIFAVYFDNFNSSQIVRNNLFYEMPCGVHINGGGHNKISNNIFAYVNTPLYSHSYESFPSVDLWNAYINLKKDESVWLARYPELSNIPDPLVPALTYCGNKFENNIFALATDLKDKIYTSGCTNINNTKVLGDIFSDKENFDFSLNNTYNQNITFDYTDVGVQEIKK